MTKIDTPIWKYTKNRWTLTINPDIQIHGQKANCTVVAAGRVIGKTHHSFEDAEAAALEQLEILERRDWFYENGTWTLRANGLIKIKDQGELSKAYAYDGSGRILHVSKPLAWDEAEALAKAWAAEGEVEDTIGDGGGSVVKHSGRDEVQAGVRELIDDHPEIFEQGDPNVAELIEVAGTSTLKKPAQAAQEPHTAPKATKPVVFPLRMSPAERDQLTKAAKAKGLTAAAYLRSILLPQIKRDLKTAD